MFSPVKMERIEAVFLEKDARAALRGLGGAGTVQLIDPSSGQGSAPSAPADNSSALSGCASLLEQLEGLRRGLGEVSRAPAAGEKTEFAHVPSIIRDWELRTAVPLELRRELTVEYARLSSESERLAVYSGLSLPADGSGLNFLYCAAGSLPAGCLPALRAKMPGDAVLLTLAEKQGRSHIAALAGRDSRAALEAELKDAGFQAEHAPGLKGTLGELAKRYSDEAKRVGEALELSGKEISALAAEAAGPFSAAERTVRAEAGLLEAEQLLPRTSASVFLSGWAPAENGPEVKRSIGENSGGIFAAETSPAGAGDEPPVLLRPPRLLRPFAALVTAYGLPRYREVEPTVFAALSFLVMFGMMFGDAGDGAVLCLAGSWLARRRGAGEREAGRAVIACGFSSIFFGLVYGGFFGLESFKKYALWRDPLDGDPLALLTASVLTGALVISLGVVLNIINRARRGDRLGAALDRFGAAGLVFYWAALLLASGKIGAGIALPVIGAGLACWALKEPALYLLRPHGEEAGEGFFAVTAEALVGAFEGALLYLANTVSFVRLAAYAMSHAALLAAAWALKRAADGAWGENSLAGILALIAGNAAAIGLEGMVAAVQALRLEYYEFFGKFFEGGGRPFRPFTLESKEGEA